MTIFVIAGWLPRFFVRALTLKMGPAYISILRHAAVSAGWRVE
jgi:hypothetical protein